MNFLLVLMACLFAIGLGACRKKAEIDKNEIQEAGYELTQEGWLKAIRANNRPVVQKMVAAGFDPKANDEKGRNGLHVAAEASSIEIADYFLNRGVAIDTIDGEKRTPLMLAVIAGKPEMVRWLLRQGADPKLKDQNGFMSLMLAITQRQPQALEELAPYHREDMDSALLLAALVGEPSAIDTLSSYGASVHARMEDGRTALMLAAENGHQKAAAILMDLGASRFATTESGETAHSFAVAAGHEEIANMIEKGFSGDTLALDSDAQITAAMEEHLQQTGQAPGKTDLNDSDLKVAVLDGARISNPTPQTQPAGQGAATVSSPQPENPPLVMRDYRQRELPVQVKTVSGDSVSLKLAGVEPAEVTLRIGDNIPKSSLFIVKVSTRTEVGKLHNNQPIQFGVVEVEDRESGNRREWIAGRPANGHDPVALVEDAVTGQRYLAKAGQKFFSEDGREFIVHDVRPSQLVIEELESGVVTTLPLRGSKG